MKWSQLQKQVRERICPELRDRISFHKAVYRKSWESMATRAWITIDRTEVFECDYHGYWEAYQNAQTEFRASHPDADWLQSSQGAAALLAEREVFETGFLSHSLHQFLDLPISAALASANPLIRAFAVIDRRTGRRTLATLNVSENDHPLIREFYALRTNVA